MWNYSFYNFFCGLTFKTEFLEMCPLVWNILKIFLVLEKNLVFVYFYFILFVIFLQLVLNYETINFEKALISNFKFGICVIFKHIGT